ncbi:DNA alkylation repair protein [Bacillus sp. DTU_2020_1000418_1_SI_GHA_SEK_038]|uniref:DNA alkylation repair protein n=1 Tax=Bacillus sp. DTU_2020_1000418_1_SI_GHA_SEK_038 TaxID=3077585 RepID=UPI0028E68879|nr:DNA alkylation repair protein [Bacillus sp. DTU_2020_1000418_1_SI_GHA_SEK_038]WNS75270.1 DNA alkylation repair protein [Bacillus sp. DTU_2020_1000418_1_SI_GHA_SEK_038]
MTYEEIMKRLEELGTEQTKKTLMRHGAVEPLFGVKIGDMKKLVKFVKKDQDLALALYGSGNYDAMYLAGLSVNPKLMTKEILQEWAKKASWYAPAEYTVAGVAAESEYALELAREWIKSDDEIIAVCGWNTYANHLSITPDESLDLNEIAELLKQVETTIHEERNRVRYVMNGFVISVGTYVQSLSEEAKKVASHIGKVHVDVGNTACKVPLAAEYIKKIEDKDRVGLKRKTCIC